MSIDNLKIRDSDIGSHGVVNAPDRLQGTAQQNKMIFDRLIRERVSILYNALIDALEAAAPGASGADSIGATEIEGVAGSTVQQILESMKIILDSKASAVATEAELGHKADKSEIQSHVKDVRFDEDTGVFVFERESGETVSIDTALEKVAVNFYYDQQAQRLVLTLADGSTQYISLADFITETEFVSSDVIGFMVMDHKVKAFIEPGSISYEMMGEQMQHYFDATLNRAEDYKTQAQQAAASAQNEAQAAGSAKADAQSYANAARDAADQAKNEATRAEQAAENAGSAESEAREAAERAESADVHTPIIENGTWRVWDFGNGRYVDTGVPARGNTGDPGPRGYAIGSVYRKSGTGTAGTTDVYGMRLDDPSQTEVGTFKVYNGANGQGSGDMTKTEYDADGTVADAGGIAAYVAKKVGGNDVVTAEYGTTDFDTVAAAMTAGKEVVCIFTEDGATYRVYRAYSQNPAIISFGCVLDTGFANIVCRRSGAATIWTGPTTAAYTAKKHKSSHASGGSDQITPSDIGAVPTERTVNGKALSSDVTLEASDVGARPNTWTPTAANVGAVPTTRTVNGKALSSNISLSASDVGARPNTWMPTAEEVGAAKTVTYTLDVHTSHWTDLGGYYGVVYYVEGIRDVDNPIADVLLEIEDLDANEAYLEAWSKVYKIDIVENYVTVLATEVPACAFSFQMKVVR